MFPLILSSGGTFLIGEMFLNHWHFREFFKLNFAGITAEGALLSIGMATYDLSDDDDREDLKACHVLQWQFASVTILTVKFVFHKYAMEY